MRGGANAQSPPLNQTVKPQSPGIISSFFSSVGSFFNPKPANMTPKPANMTPKPANEIEASGQRGGRRRRKTKRVKFRRRKSLRR